jgi:hypothetical protein
MVGDFLFAVSYSGSLLLIRFKKIVMPNLFRHPTGQVANCLAGLLSKWGVETSST